MACKYTKYYNNVDWEKRKNDFFQLVEKFKKDNQDSIMIVLLLLVEEKTAHIKHI